MITADLSGFGRYIGAVEGTLDAVASPGTEDDLINTIMNEVKRQFMMDAMAANQAGHDNISHMFDWGPQDGSGVATGAPGTIPLFRLTKNGGARSKYLSFKFLPSTLPVPLPDPAVYGFKADKLEHLSRHIFHMKAVVMETQASVTIRAKHSDRGLFIPTGVTEDTPYGYVMTKRAVTIQPGGPQSTGAFSLFWKTWFDSRGQMIAEQEAHSAELSIAKVGRRVVRYKAGTKINGVSVGGRYASGQGVSVGFISAQKRSAEQYAKNLLKEEFSDGRIWDDEE